MKALLDWIYAKAKLEGDNSREWAATGANNDMVFYRVGMANCALEIADYIERNPECLKIEQAKEKNDMKTHRSCGVLPEPTQSSSSDEQAEQLAREWREVITGDEMLLEDDVKHCARLHLAAVAEKDKELGQLRHNFIVSQKCVAELREDLNIKRDQLRESDTKITSLEQENRRLVEDGQRDMISFNHAAKFATDAMLKMANDIHTLRTALRAVCEAAKQFLNPDVTDTGYMNNKTILHEALTAAASLLAKHPAGKGGV